MRNRLIGMLAAACVLASAPSFGADERNITIYNATGYGIKFIGVNPPGDDDFDENELSEVLKDGEKRLHQVQPGRQRLQLDDQDRLGHDRLPVAAVAKPQPLHVNDIRLLYNGATGTTSHQTR